MKGKYEPVRAVAVVVVGDADGVLAAFTVDGQGADAGAEGVTRASGGKGGLAGREGQVGCRSGEDVA